MMMQRNAHVNGNRVTDQQQQQQDRSERQFGRGGGNNADQQSAFCPQSQAGSASGMSPVPVNLPLNSSPYSNAPQDSSLLQPTQLSPQSACVSPRPSSSGTMLDMTNASTNGYHRACSPSSLSGGSSSPNSVVVQSGKANGGHSSMGKQGAASPPNVSGTLANRSNIRVVIPNSHVNMVRHSKACIKH